MRASCTGEKTAVVGLVVGSDCVSRGRGDRSASVPVINAAREEIYDAKLAGPSGVGSRGDGEGIPVSSRRTF